MWDTDLFLPLYISHQTLIILFILSLASLAFSLRILFREELSFEVICQFFLASADTLYSALPSGCSDFPVDF